MVSRRKTGVDLRIARSLAGLAQGQLAIKTLIPAQSLRNWETKGTMLPEWVVEEVSKFLEWPDESTKEQELARQFTVRLAGCTRHQFEQKVKMLGSYVVDAWEDE